jgi:beta-lactamase class D
MKRISIIIIILTVISACSVNPKTEIHPEFKSFFDEYEVEGCFLLYDFEKEKTIVYNQERCEKGFLPASTFKMVNTLIGLDNGIITGVEFIIPWDSVNRQIPAWNREHNLKTAFQNSVVPWYQELARKIGVKNMKTGVEKARFGNMDISEKNIDLFWLRGNSRITAYEQLDFQKRLIKNELPFQQKDIDLLKKIMIMEETPETILRGKTGWAVMEDKNIGWLSGYLESGSKTYSFVINVESNNEDPELFAKSRMEITLKILETLKLI